MKPLEGRTNDTTTTAALGHIYFRKVECLYTLTLSWHAKWEMYGGVDAIKFITILNYFLSCFLDSSRIWSFKRNVSNFITKQISASAPFLWCLLSRNCNVSSWFHSKCFGVGKQFLFKSFPKKPNNLCNELELLWTILG